MLCQMWGTEGLHLQYFITHEQPDIIQEAEEIRNCTAGRKYISEGCVTDWVKKKEERRKQMAFYGKI